MSEELLVTHCAPTLAGMKTGSLFNCKCESLCCIKAAIKEWNSILNCKGVYMSLLTVMKDRALIYVFRPEKLAKDIGVEEVQSFLKEQGYRNCYPDACIKRLSERLRRYETFPHEIGIFLGYPIEDVKGFIENKGQNCKCIGYWKVYNNEKEAEKTFQKYKKCTTIYRKKLKEGRSIEKLVVQL
ncbi:MAG: DUF3793 family protein [Clostridiales bacterium]|jgi:hypothetical protein|nr:DUF3793 family protein [Clostridiales bacterium]MDU6853774.1 DUF3793 family protein [Clostridiales bacterium]MDU6973627.1 DUF3793 family protein [Clostridiales bacterium]